jgi:hypothetical protein
VLPSDVRFGCEYAPELGPVEHFIPAIEECAYKPDDGTGRKDGVAGREDGVGMELVVAVVLRLAAESRD